MCPAFPCQYMFNANHHQTTGDQKTNHHASLPEPTSGCRVRDQCGASGLCDTLQTEPCSCTLTFPLICSSRQSNAIINKDHKQVMAFIHLKFMVQKRSFSGPQCWLLFGRYFLHSLTTRWRMQSLLMRTQWLNWVTISGSRSWAIKYNPSTNTVYVLQWTIEF